VREKSELQKRGNQGVGGKKKFGKKTAEGEGRPVGISRDEDGEGKEIGVLS